MRTSSPLGFVLVAVFAVACSGCCCKKKNAPTEPVVQDAAPEVLGVKGDEETEEEHQDAKTDRLIKCYNRTLRINKAANLYFTSLRKAEPAKGRIPVVLGAYEDGPKICEDAKGDVTPAMPTIDPLVAEYASLVKDVTGKLDEMQGYYKTKQYEVDKFAKGKELHRAFKTSYERFRKLNDEFSTALDHAADDRDNKSIVKASANKNLHYYSLVFLRDSKYLIREAARDVPSAKVFGELRKKLDASFAEFSAHAKGHSDEVAKVAMFAPYMSRAEEFIAAVRSTEGNAVHNDDEMRMLDKFNSMIESSNTIRRWPSP